MIHIKLLWNIFGRKCAVLNIHDKIAHTHTCVWGEREHVSNSGLLEETRRGRKKENDGE
jgi:hypothetical protein